MCGLCGIFNDENHWSHGREKQISADPVQRRRDRTKRIKIANRFLASSQLTLRDWQGEKYILEGRSGKSEILNNITEIWLCMDEQFGGAFDPLTAVEIMREDETRQS